MKNVLRFAAVPMVTIMLCLTLASCGGPNADPDDALAALKENGVTWAAKDNTVLPGVYKLLGVDDVECVVSGTGKIDGANLTLDETLAKLKALGVDGIESVGSGTDKTDDSYAHITIIYFEEKDDANDAWEKIQKESEDDKKDADEDAEWVCKKSGKMIYYGTKEAINAAK